MPYEFFAAFNERMFTANDDWHGSERRSGDSVFKNWPRQVTLRWMALVGVVVLGVLGLAACGGDTGASGQFPVSMDDQQVSAGQQVYATNCASCHGEVTGRPTLPFAPPHGAEGHTWHHDDRQLFGWILDGLPQWAVMPAFRGVLSDSEVSAVLAYMKSEWPSDIRGMQTRQTVEYERQLRQQGLLE